MADSEPPRRKPRFRERHAIKEAPETTRQIAPSPPVARPSPRRPRLALPTLGRGLTLEQALYLLLLAGGFTIRIWDVGARAMHGDEAVHAWTAWNLYRGAGYQYDPVYHGPLQFILTTFLFFLFGVSNASARLLAVLFGTALICLPYFLRSYVGRPAALVTAAFITISPAFVYMSRLERDDILTCTFAFTLAIAIFLYVRTRNARYVYLAATSLALSFSAMENTFITAFVFGSFLFIVLIAQFISSRPGWGPRVQALCLKIGHSRAISPALVGLLLALLLLAFIPIFLDRSLPAVPTYMPFLLLVSLLLVGLVFRQAVVDVLNEGQPAFLNALRSIKLQTWLNALTIVIAILFLAFSTFGTNLNGIWDHAHAFINSHGACPGNNYALNPCRKDFIGGLFYWLSQHHVHRGGQPWFYYTFLFTLYEQIALILGLAGIVWFLLRPTLFTSFLTYWAVLMFGIYSWAGEKFPWLMIHPLLPLTLLSAMFVAELFRMRRPVWVAAIILLSLLGPLELHNTYEVNFVNGANPVEMMVYVQSSPDTSKVANNIMGISNKVTNGNGLHVTIDSDDSWPFAWYLRDMPNVAYPSFPLLGGQKGLASNPVIIVDESHQPALYSSVHAHYSGHRYRLRWWFPEDYKDLGWPAFRSDLMNGGYWNAYWSWEIERKPFGPRGAVWFYYYVRKGLVAPF